MTNLKKLTQKSLSGYSIEKSQITLLNKVLVQPTNEETLSANLSQARSIDSGATFTKLIAWISNSKSALYLNDTWNLNGKKITFKGIEYTNKNHWITARSNAENLQFSAFKFNKCLKLANYLYGVDGSASDFQNNLFNLMTWIDSQLITDIDKHFISFLNKNGIIQKEKCQHLFKSAEELEQEAKQLEERTLDVGNGIEIVVENPKSKKEIREKTKQAYLNKEAELIAKIDKCVKDKANYEAELAKIQSK